MRSRAQIPVRMINCYQVDVAVRFTGMGGKAGSRTGKSQVCLMYKRSLSQYLKVTSQRGNIS
jgi:hypothetical protein